MTSSDPDGDGRKAPKYRWQCSKDGISWKKVGRSGSLKISKKHIGKQLRFKAMYQDLEGFKETVITNVGKIKEGLNLPKVAKRPTILQLKSPFRIGSLKVINLLMGTNLEDKLIGTPRSDLIIGHRQQDQLTSGRGEFGDVFLLNTDQLGKQRADLITDFTAGDLIALDLEPFSRGGRFKFKTVKKTRQLKRIARKSHVLIYDISKGELFFNQNGKDVGFGDDGGLLATFKGSPNLSNKQFTYLDLIVNADG